MKTTSLLIATMFSLVSLVIAATCPHVSTFDGRACPICARANTQQAPSKAAQSLLTALSTTHNGETYEEVDCTQFVRDALARSGIDMTKDLENEILLTKYGDTTIEGSLNNVLKAMKEGDNGVGGVANALVKRGLGEDVGNAFEIIPGDIVQYWRVDREGADKRVSQVTDVKWGHAAIVTSTDGKGRVNLWGSHSKIGGVGELKGIDLGSGLYEAWVVRLK